MRQSSEPAHSVLKAKRLNRLCRVCEGKVHGIISLGRMPLANAFLGKQDFEREYFFDLGAGVCSECFMFQLNEQPDPSRMFHPEYPFYTGSSSRMVEHFHLFAENLKANYLEPGAFVVEVGSNDGTFLENFKQGFRVLGVEPSQNVARAAMRKGISTENSFFDRVSAEKISSEYGRADVVVASNCLCHIQDPSLVFEGIRLLLKDSGIAVFEDPYLGEVLAKTAYDQIYDEHVFLFSVTSMCEMVSRFGFEIFDLEPQWTHGGSMRYFVCRKGQRQISPKIKEWLEKENRAGYKDFQPYEEFRNRCEQSRERLLDCLNDFKRRAIRVAGYAATSKSTTVLNYCGIGSDLIEYIADTTPEKQGKFTPGSHIPVRPYEDFKKDYPQAAVLFAWNHAKEILEKENKFKEAGGKWIHFVPEVYVE